MWQAWHTEAFARTKRLPNLKKVFAQLDRAADGRPAGKTPDELLKAIEAAHAVFSALADRKTSKKEQKKNRKERRG